MKKPFTLHPFLFALFPILFLYAQNAEAMHPTEILRSILVVLVFTVIASILLFLLLKDRKKTGIIISIFLILFFSFGHIVKLINSVEFLTNTTNFSATIFTSIFWISLFVIVTGKTLKTNTNLSNTTRFLNTASILLVSIQLATSSLSLLKTEKVAISENSQPENPTKITLLPDIYYIVMDGYGRSDVLHEMFEFDNTKFLNSLREQGFFIANNAHSNYGQTMLSLASCLNFDYIHNLVKGTENIMSLIPLAYLLKHNKVVQYLKSHGYSFISFSTGYSLTEMSYADRFFTPTTFILPEFETVLLANTPLPLLLPRKKSAYSMHRQRIMYTLGKLSNIIDYRSPKIVVAHILSPHPPFVFGENGEHVEPNRNYSLHDGIGFVTVGGTTREYYEGYKNQITHITKLLQDTLTKILSKADKRNPPIIIVHGDHGSGLQYTGDDISQNNLKERFSIFTAMHLPGFKANSISTDITPVNFFRIIFNQYFGTNHPLLESKIFYSSWRKPYLFTEISEQELQ